MLRSMLHRLRLLRLLPRRLFGELHNIREDIRATNAQQMIDRAQMLAELAEVRPQIAGCEREMARFCDEVIRIMRGRRDVETVLGNSVTRTEHLVGELRDISREQRSELEHMQKELGRLRETLAAQARLLPSWFWKPSTAEGVRAVLRLIEPHGVEGVAKVRLGRPNDGGYVMIDDFAGVAAAISAGINDDVSWDLEIAERGIRVQQYDHTIAALPEQHANFVFHKRRIAARDSDDAVSLNTLLRAQQDAGAGEIILKVDIEGDEWTVLADTDPLLLEQCRQVTVEFHDMYRLGEEPFAAVAERALRNFADAGFFVAHAHGNNCAGHGQCRERGVSGGAGGAVRERAPVSARAGERGALSDEAGYAESGW